MGNDIEEWLINMHVSHTVALKLAYNMQFELHPRDVCHLLLKVGCMGLFFGHVMQKQLRKRSFLLLYNCVKR